MGERQFNREEIIEALKQASDQAIGSEDTLMTESEVIQMAREMGVDERRLRTILSKGTGIVETREIVSKGWAWPGNEEFERRIDGQLSQETLEEISDVLGSNESSQESLPGKESREYIDGWRHVSIDITSRNGKTRVLAHSRVAWSRINPLLPLIIGGSLLAAALSALNTPEAFELNVSVIIHFLILGYLWAGYQMRKGRDSIRQKLDHITEMIQSSIKVGANTPLADSLPNREGDELTQRLGE